jgi:hypothetical protein
VAKDSKAVGSYAASNFEYLTNFQRNLAVFDPDNKINSLIRYFGIYQSKWCENLENLSSFDVFEKFVIYFRLEGPKISYEN